MSKLISDNPDFFCHNNWVSSRLIYNRVSEDPLIFQVGGYLVYRDLKTKKAYLLSAKTVREAKDEISMIPK